MIDKDSFFDYRNTINSVTDSDIEHTKNYLAAIEAFSRVTYASIYVIDYLKKGFEFVSDNPLFLCGNTSDEVLKMGYAFYFKHVPKDDLDFLLRINNIGFDYYEKIPLGDRLLYTLSYDFHLVSLEGKKILINQQLTPMFLTSEGKVWKALCIISLSTGKGVGNIKVFKKGDNKVIEYDLDAKLWKTADRVILSKRETEILQYSSKGYTINDIAEVIFVSVDTVKFHRKKLFEKLQVSNITEAITCATNNKLI